jgi:hypothetical protein
MAQSSHASKIRKAIRSGNIDELINLCHICHSSWPSRYIRHYDGQSPYHTAASTNTNGEIIRTLFKLIGTGCIDGSATAYSTPSPIFNTVDKGDSKRDISDVVAALLELGIGLEACDQWHNTVLYSAVYWNNLIAAKLFLELGANPNASCYHYTPVDKAVLCCNWDITEMLVRFGGSFNTVIINGRTHIQFMERECMYYPDDLRRKQMLRNMLALEGDYKRWCQYFDQAEFEDTVLEIRYRVYFGWPLLSRLLVAQKIEVQTVC